MKTYEASAIRNILLVGHGGAGKTSLAEALLFASGTTTRMGTVEDGNTVTDFEPEEIKKNISVSLALAPIEWRDVKINILDAPGYADFIGDVRAALQAADACLFVVSAVEGVEVQHEVVWEMAVDAGLARAFFVNKLDRERASFQRTLDGLTQGFGTQVAPLQFPLGEEHDFEGVADFLSRKGYRYGGSPKGEEGDWPDDIAGKADPYREKLAESVAEADDALLEKYLEEGELSEEEIVRGVKAGLAEAKLAPVLCGSAAKGIGIDRLADFIVDAFPSPVDRPPVKVMTKDGEEQERPCDPAGPLTSFVFKTISDPYVGRINLFRVFSGRMRPDTTAFNATRGKEERVGQLFTMRGKEHETVSEVPAGDIGAVAKLAHTQTGDTLSTKDQPVTLPAVEWPEPLYALAIEPKTQGDEDKLSTALTRLMEEDATFRVERQMETHQTVMYGMGEAHLDVMSERMQRKFGVGVVSSPAKVPYKETIRTKVQAIGRHVKQSGGHGQYGIAHIEAEPLERGTGFEFVNKIVGGAIPSQFIPSVEKGIVKAMETGTTGHQMVDVRVTLFDGKFHTVDSSDMAFQIAGSLAIKEAVQKAGVVLLEPIVDVEIVVPESYTGDIIGDLNSKRGRVLGMEQTGSGKSRVKAQVPQAEMTRYAIDLRSITGGRGAFTMKFSHYEEVPSHLAEKIIAEAEREKEEAHK
ncbi:MAG TPA: elongation factor G [Actinomycetota bacterium]|nr:elongation factor G [Actinomycetota bacterium]